MSFLKELNKFLIDRGYNEISKELDAAYERGASQKEINDLETELANFVSDEDVISYEPAASEGISVHAGAGGSTWRRCRDDRRCV